MSPSSSLSPSLVHYPHHPHKARHLRKKTPPIENNISIEKCPHLQDTASNSSSTRRAALERNSAKLSSPPPSNTIISRISTTKTSSILKSRSPETWSPLFACCALSLALCLHCLAHLTTCTVMVTIAMVMFKMVMAMVMMAMVMMAMVMVTMVMVMVMWQLWRLVIVTIRIMAMDGDV